MHRQTWIQADVQTDRHCCALSPMSIHQPRSDLLQSSNNNELLHANTDAYTTRIHTHTSHTHTVHTHPRHQQRLDHSYMYKETVCSLSSLWQISTRGKNISLPFLSSTSLFTLLKPQMCLLTSFTHFFALHFSLLLWRNLLSLFYLDHRCEPAVLDYSGSQEVGSELCQSLRALPLPPGPERTSHPVEDGSLTPYGGDPALTQERAAGVGVGVMITCIS